MQPGVAGQAGKSERQEYEYIRHGTQCLTANFELVTGKQIAPSIGATRTEPDKIRLGEMTTLVKVTRETQALEITWEPKNDKKDDQAYTSVVQLNKEPAAMVNGYILAEPGK